MIQADAYRNLVNSLPKEVRLIAVSKTKPISDIAELYALGQREFGENKVQELMEKIEELEADIKWHLIGPLQRNKVNKVVGKVELIHSVDSLALAEKIDRRAEQLNIKQALLIQMNISEEESKSGFLQKGMEITFEKLTKLKHISIDGLMTIAAHVSDETEIRRCFKNLMEWRNRLSQKFSMPLDVLSMGMSNDFQLAIEEGATMIRVGSLIFGKRDYQDSKK